MLASFIMSARDVVIYYALIMVIVVSIARSARFHAHQFRRLGRKGIIQEIVADLNLRLWAETDLSGVY